MASVGTCLTFKIRLFHCDCDDVLPFGARLLLLKLSGLHSIFDNVKMLLLIIAVMGNGFI